jgi:elongation factor 1-gamma
MLCSVQAHIEQWIDFSATEIDVNIEKWLYPRLGVYQYVAVVGVAM